MENDGEVTCGCGNRRLNRSDMNCWRCGSRNLNRERVVGMAAETAVPDRPRESAVQAPQRHKPKYPLGCRVACKDVRGIEGPGLIVGHYPGGYEVRMDWLVSGWGMDTRGNVHWSDGLVQRCICNEAKP